MQWAYFICFVTWSVTIWTLLFVCQWFGDADINMSLGTAGTTTNVCNNIWDGHTCGQLQLESCGKIQSAQGIMVAGAMIHTMVWVVVMIKKLEQMIPCRWLLEVIITISGFMLWSGIFIVRSFVSDNHIRPQAHAAVFILAAGVTASTLTWVLLRRISSDTTFAPSNERYGHRLSTNDLDT